MPTLDSEGGLIIDVGTAVAPLPGEQISQLQTKQYETLSSSDIDTLTIGTGANPSLTIQRVVGGSTVGSWQWIMDSSNNLILDRVTGTGIYVWNEVGASVDFRMEGDTDTEVFFLDGSENRVGFSTTTPATLVDIQGALTVNGILSQDDVTDTTSTTSGSIHTDGGLGIALDLWVGAQLNVAGTGPHAIGGATVDFVSLGILGSFTSLGAATVMRGMDISQTLTGADGDTGRLVGVEIDPTIITQTATETIATIVSLRIDEPNITDNLTGDITNAATVHIVSAPTEGEANYALWVDDGAVQIDSTLTVDGTIVVGGRVNNFYRTVNSEGPEIALGATTLNDFSISVNYDGGTQVIDNVLISTISSSGTADKGKMQFAVDGAIVLDLVDAGVLVGGTLTVNSTGLSELKADIRIGDGNAVATNATTGFLFLTGCAGTPTGNPTNDGVGSVALVYDTTNNLLYANDGGGWVAVNSP